MATQSVSEIEKRLRVLFEEISTFRDMRPGTLSLQYRKPEERKHPFHQLSYTHQGKSRSEYVRAENLHAIEREIKAYKRFRELSEEIVSLSIEASRMRCKRQSLGQS
ncbi:MAG: hypothetical protein JJU29_02540 [Verrucomicrobia bacterium]|nr:hypothetical protein [Verrucomicrobiota bacterium]MCH8511215.1 hypothetical protein [Kiritimatiellia bacterium]